MTAALRITLGQCSQAGRGGINQDFHGAAVPAGPRLASKGIVVALADGIGSSAVSQVASAAAVRGFLDDYYGSSDAWPVKRAARCVLHATNSWLHAQTQRSPARFDKDLGYVCTFSALVLKGREAHLVHVGDTRIYRLHAHALEQLTEDHRVRVSASESYLGQALGAGRVVEIDYRSWTTEVGEVYLLATDGAYEYLDAAAVHAALTSHPGDFDAAASALVASAAVRGSTDDRTVQIVRIDGLPTEAVHRLHDQRAGLALPPALAPRMDFEGYTIVRELQASARSHLHLALDRASGQQVVLKTPSVDLRENADHLDRFMLEEWVARRLDSPHVLKARADDRPRRHLYVAMEYIDGQTLGQWMTDHPRPELDSVRSIVEQAARGLQAFHRKEMLHQDLRPENIMIDRSGTVKIIDFGATHVAGLVEGTLHARPDALLGSLQYTAPEYFIGDGGSPQSDLFSLAVITYQMLTGGLPYGLQVTRVRGVGDLAGLHYIPARSLRRDLPPWLDAVLRQALHPRPAKRQQALSEFVHDLRSPRPQHLQARHSPLIERDPVLFWRSLALALAVAVLGLAGVLAARV